MHKTFNNILDVLDILLDLSFLNTYKISTSKMLRNELTTMN